jgi:hypothetical protein
MLQKLVSHCLVSHLLLEICLECLGNCCCAKGSKSHRPEADAGGGGSGRGVVGRKGDMACNMS